MPIATTSAPSGFTYSCSSVYSSSFGISDTTRSQVDDGVGKLARGVYPSPKTVSRNSDCARRTSGFRHQRIPDVVHAPLELGQRAFVVDDEVGAGPFELRGHLRGDHVHRFGCREPALLHESLVAERTICIDEHDAIEPIRHLEL